MSFLSGLSDFIEMVADQRTGQLEKFMSSLITTPVSWNGYKYIHDLFDPKIKNPQHLGHRLLHDTRVFYDYGIVLDTKVPNRINVFGETVEKMSLNRSVLGTLGMLFGIGVGYESISDPVLSNIVTEVLHCGMRLPASNGKVSIKVNGDEYMLTGKDSEQFLIYRGQHFAEAVRRNENLILHYTEKIKAGEESYIDNLKRLLQKLHHNSVEFGKREMANEIREKSA